MEKGKKDMKGISVKKAEDISKWYTEVITKGDLIDYSDVSGCIIMKPACTLMWEKVVQETDRRFKAAGIQNVTFPLFIPEKHLCKEADHVEGFSPEVAWVTHTGDSKLSERLAVRPTSETIMYPSYAKWIRSWRDLPMRYNQWNNVVRWEFNNPVPILRSREIWWCEGHTVFATEEEAKAEGDEIIGIFQEVLKDYMAIYGVEGYKSEKEHFAGAVYTISIESFLDSGKAIQGPDFHHDGQKFAKAFDITFLDKNGEKQYAWQNTFAITTRMIGVMAMMHGDDKGLVLPPKMAPTQIAIVPIFKGDSKKNVFNQADKLAKELANYSVVVDKDEEYSPGWKYHQYEMHGVPLRIELGPRDIANKECIVVRRDTGEKQTVKLSEIVNIVPKIFDDMQKTLYEKSKKLFHDNLIETSDFDALVSAVDAKKIVLAPFCNTIECEDLIKDKTSGITTRCIPLDAKKPAKGQKCVHCDKEATCYIYFARAY